MHIAILFQFYNEGRPAAVTEVEGMVTDVLLPEVGDTLNHTDIEGNPFRAQVLGRHFDYALGQGKDVDGSLTVVLSMKRITETQVH